MTLPPASRHTRAAADSRAKPPTQNSHSCTCCAVVATRVEWTATPATTCSEWEGEAQATQEQEAERLRIESSLSRRGETCERLSAHGATLRQHQRFLGVAERGPHLGNAFLVESGGCGPLPPGPWCCAVFITLWRIPSHSTTPRIDSERVSWCISPMIKCATSGWRFWTMANPSAQLAQYAAMCVLDALCRPSERE